MAVRLTGWEARRGLVAVVGVLIACALQGCASDATPQPSIDPTPLPDLARVADLRLTLGDSLDASEREILERLDVAALVRLAALDWFEHEHRFDVEGEVHIEVEVLAMSLASSVSAWLWRGLAGDDTLDVRVRVRDSVGPKADFVWTERTAVGGFEWRDPDLRLDRMARRLGRRIAELL